MASSTLNLPFLAFFVLAILSIASSIPSSTIADAVDFLSTSGYTAMALTFSLISPTLTLIPTATLFTPSDHSFLLSLPSGQPPLSLLLLHVSPNLYSSTHLSSLFYGTQLPTLAPLKTLTVTTADSDELISINGVHLISDRPIFSDGFLTIFAIGRFFDPNFTAAVSPSSGESHLCSRGGYASGSYVEVSGSLRSRGYNTMATFLKLQFSNFDAYITVFAPTDDVIKGHLGNFSNWNRLFLRHVVACELSWDDLLGLDHGSVLETFLDRFYINVTHCGDNVLLNGEVSVELPDLYHGDGIVVHGLSGVLSDKLCGIQI